VPARQIVLLLGSTHLRCGAFIKITNPTYEVNMAASTIRTLLGFDPQTLGMGYREGEKPMDIMSVNSILTNCSLVNGSYLNTGQLPVIYSFFPNVCPGYKIIETPHNLVYLPISASGNVTSLRVWLTDQNGVQLKPSGRNDYRTISHPKHVTMFVYERPKAIKRYMVGSGLVDRRQYVVGSGIIDWIAKSVGTAARVISTNKDAIKNVAGVVGKVAKTGATTAAAVKQIVDTVKTKHIPPPLKKDLSDKSAEVVKQLSSSTAGADINARISGAGFRTLRY
jgi:hypothetical protein